MLRWGVCYVGVCGVCCVKLLIKVRLVLQPAGGAACVPAVNDDEDAPANQSPVYEIR